MLLLCALVLLLSFIGFIMISRTNKSWKPGGNRRRFFLSLTCRSSVRYVIQPQVEPLQHLV